MKGIRPANAGDAEFCHPYGAQVAAVSVRYGIRRRCTACSSSTSYRRFRWARTGASIVRRLSAG